MKRAARAVVPASTSNLGPGFDSIGLALGLYNEVSAELRPEPGEPIVEIIGEGAGSLPKDGTNLVARAARSLGDFEGRLVIHCKNNIPTGRGLGSSAAAIVGGLLVGVRLLGLKLPRERLFEHAAVLEGHPDNVAPCLYGGLVVAVRERRGPAIWELSPHRSLCAVVCSPDFELATSKARAVLPRTILREDAIENVGRALLLSSALERGHWDRLGPAMEDRLHQPYRAPLVKGLRQVLDAARRAGTCGAALSGAGPSVLALCRSGRQASAIGRAMEKAFAAAGVNSVWRVLAIDRKGARFA